MHIPSRVARYVQSNPVIMHCICDTKAVWHYWPKSPQLHSWAAQSAGGNNVEINPCISLILVKVWQGSSSEFCQAFQAEQMAIKSLTCQREDTRVSGTVKEKNK